MLLISYLILLGLLLTYSEHGGQWFKATYLVPRISKGYGTEASA